LSPYHPWPPPLHREALSLLRNRSSQIMTIWNASISYCCFPLPALSKYMLVPLKHRIALGVGTGLIALFAPRGDSFAA
jgi:hypothetical protein